ncbi:hypothetical protein Tco_0733064 [Tanacetum coccineum]
MICVERRWSRSRLLKSSNASVNRQSEGPGSSGGHGTNKEVRLELDAPNPLLHPPHPSNNINNVVIMQLTYYHNCLNRRKRYGQQGVLLRGPPYPLPDANSAACSLVYAVGAAIRRSVRVDPFIGPI